jgi:hypothetical protein
MLSFPSLLSENASHITCHFRYYYALLRLCLTHVFEEHLRYYSSSRTCLRSGKSGTSCSSVHIVRCVRVFKGVQLKSRDTVASDRQQQDHPAVCIIAQQYTTATFFLLRFHSGKEKFKAFRKCYYFISFLIFKLK